ncbi:S41 family peptidase [Pedobacter heparinus]|uniref:S41 family peptidase n=1 Tax=Pedobacter heparinus TaxID=984 RepID=UPI00292E3220|nr:S41 family peptidase [Pedobacter heparinus]
MIKRLLLVFYFMIAAYEGKSAGLFRDSTLFSAHQLKSDLQYFKILMEKAHPSLYRYVKKDSFNKLFEQASQRITSATDEFDFFQMLQAINSKVGCGHTNLRLSIAAQRKLWARNIPMLPFYISIDSNRLYIQRYIQAPGAAGYRINDEIMSINGLSAREILTKTRSLVGSDAHSNAYKDYRLEKGEFNWLYACIYGNHPEFNFVLKRKGTAISITIKSVVSTKTFKPLKEQEIADSLKLSFPPNLRSTAILKIRHFKDHDFFTDNRLIFKRLEDQKIEHLVIDLRNNPGGRSDMAIDLMKHLIGKTFRFSKQMEAVVDIAKFSALFVANKSPSLAVLKEFPHSWHREESVWSRRQEPYKKQFKGKVFILVNGGTFSSAALLAIALKTQMECLLIGEESGGGSWGCNGGKVLNVNLPETGFQLSLPLMWTYAINDLTNTGMGVMPDYYVKWDIFKVDNPKFQNADPLLKKVAALIR